MAKLMFITPRMTGGPSGGREPLSRLHFECLRDLLGDRLVLHELERPKSTRGLAALHALRGRIDGITAATEKAIAARIGTEAIDRVYLDGSNLGRLALTIKRAHPNVEILTFFHNVEARFFAGALRQRPGVRALAVLVANWQAERLAVRSSDRLIALNQRDSDGLASRYGRGATEIVPMALEDRASTHSELLAAAGYVLFVGADFYANRAGIIWFAKEVAPHLDKETWIVGKGMEALRPAVEHVANIRVVGSVDTLHQYYAGAHVVIAPIFDGSGMKTKVAEALMFGKHVAGTAEAFSGYEAISDLAGWICNSRDEFIAVLNGLGPLPGFDPALRAIYERDYSRAALTRRLSAIIG